MHSDIDHILFQESWTEEELDVLRRACSEDVELADLVTRWGTITAHLRSSIDASMPEPEALVLLALSRSDYASELTSEEVARLHILEQELSETLESHPSVKIILARIRKDADHFERLWSEATVPVEPEQHANDRSPLRLRLVSSRLSRIGWSLAAALAITVFALVLSRSDLQTIRTSDGERRVVALADGSVVRLTENSSLTFASESDRFDRQVTLTGGAYFDVSEAAEVFRVETENAVTRVLGTQFGVIVESAVTEVTLVSGSVSVESLLHPSDPVILEPGQASLVRGNDLPSTPERVVLADALAWARLFIFRDTALSDIVERLSQSYEVTITLDPEIAGEVLTGTFSAEQGIQEILEVISDALGIQLVADIESGSFTLRS